MRKKLMFIGTLCIVCALFFFGKSEQVHAATNFTSIHAGDWVSEDNVRTVGGTTFRIEDNGGFFSGSNKSLYVIRNHKKTLLASDGKKSKLSNRIITDGKIVYYVKIELARSLDGRRIYNKRFRVYCVKITGGKSKQIYSIKPESPSADNDFGIIGIYGGKIFFESNGHISCYTIKTKKYENLNIEAKSSTVKIRQYRNYIYIWKRPWGVGYLQILNAKTKKVEASLKGVVPCSTGGLYSSGEYDIISGKLYYLEQIGETKYNSYCGDYNYVAVKRCNLDGSREKTLVKKIAVAQAKPVVFKKHSLIYYNSRGRKKTQKF